MSEQEYLAFGSAIAAIMAGWFYFIERPEAAITKRVRSFRRWAWTYTAVLLLILYALAGWKLVYGPEASFVYPLPQSTGGYRARLVI